MTCSAFPSAEGGGAVRAVAPSPNCYRLPTMSRTESTAQPAVVPPRKPVIAGTRIEPSSPNSRPTATHAIAPPRPQAMPPISVHGSETGLASVGLQGTGSTGPAMELESGPRPASIGLQGTGSTGPAIGLGSGPGWGSGIGTGIGGQFRHLGRLPLPHGHQSGQIPARMAIIN